MIRYFKANSGSKLSSFAVPAPGDSWENIQDRIYDAGRCVARAGRSWAGPKKTPAARWRAPHRGPAAARSPAASAFCARWPTACNGYAASKGIKIKALKPYPGDGPGRQLKWDVTLPALMSIDDGRDSDNRRKDYDKGFRNDGRYFCRSRDRVTKQAHWERRAAFVSMRKRAAALENLKPENVKLGRHGGLARHDDGNTQ